LKLYNNILYYILYICEYSRNFHKGIKYECAQCKDFFDTKENLELHQKTAQHNLNPIEGSAEVHLSLEKIETQNEEQNILTAPSEVTDDSNDVIHKCEKCDKQFESKQKYELHVRVMHELQKFTCNVCNKTFLHQSNLKMHMASHGVCTSKFIMN